MKYIKLFEGFLNEALPTRFDRMKGSGSSNPRSFWAGAHHIVIDDPKNGIAKEDPKKADNIINLINKEIEKRADILDMDFKNLVSNGILDSIKYYEKTDKIVGKIPAFMFFKHPMKNKNGIDRAYFYRSVSQRYPDLELRLKKTIK